MAAVFLLSACRTVEMDSQRVMTPPEMVRPASIQATIKQVFCKIANKGGWWKNPAKMSLWWAYTKEAIICK
jgi:hypothetical protein